MKSPILQRHTEHAIQLADAGDWELAEHYGDSARECVAATEGAGVRDATHLSRLDFSGADHLDFLHRMTTNDFADLQVGGGRRAVFPDSRGRIVEVGTLCRLTETTTRFVGGPEARKTLPAWVDRYIFAEQISWADRIDDTCMLELFGPRAVALSAALLGVSLEAVPLYGRALESGGLSATRLDLGPLPGIQVSGEIDEAIKLWDNLLGNGVDPVGELATEALRVQYGIPIAGPELNEDHNPWEAGLTDAVRLDKGCYIGQEVIARLDTYDKVKQRLVGLKLGPGELPAAKTILRSERGREAGTITSAVCSSLLGHSIALAYVRAADATPGARLYYGDAPSTADVIELPFSEPV